MDTEFPQKLS